MTRFDPLKLRDQAVEKGLVFPLVYHTDKGDRTIDVFMVRHPPSFGEDSDSFAVHEAKNGVSLAWDDTKKDAKSLAKIALHQKFDFGIGLPKVDLE